jgi:hypothetical protein
VEYDHPSKRPGIIDTVTFHGDDDDLSMVVEWSEGHDSGAVTFQLQNLDEGQCGTICLPANSSLDDASKDSIEASIRMHAFLSGSIAGSDEFLAMFAVGGGNDIKSAVGNLRIDSVVMVDGLTFNINIKRGVDTLAILTDHRAVSHYSYAPSTQLLVIAGAVRAEFPSYVHDYPTHVLTQGERGDIEAYVLGLELWV